MEHPRVAPPPFSSTSFTHAAPQSKRWSCLPFSRCPLPSEVATGERWLAEHSDAASRGFSVPGLMKKGWFCFLPLWALGALSQKPAVIFHGGHMKSPGRQPQQTCWQDRLPPEGEATLDAPHHQSLCMVPPIARRRRITWSSTADCQNHGRQ